ncbi:MAG: hypothetical protein JW734_00560 [Candidatus Omnitrophica bacterium]|nr:hypothetical protein [Candidatus Omnitrophota bacterium]
MKKTLILTLGLVVVLQGIGFSQESWKNNISPTMPALSDSGNIRRYYKIVDNDSLETKVVKDTTINGTKGILEIDKIYNPEGKLIETNKNFISAPLLGFGKFYQPNNLIIPEKWYKEWLIEDESRIRSEDRDFGPIIAETEGVAKGEKIQNSFWIKSKDGVFSLFHESCKFNADGIPTNQKIEVFTFDLRIDSSRQLKIFRDGALIEGETSVITPELNEKDYYQTVAKVGAKLQTACENFDWKDDSFDKMKKDLDNLLYLVNARDYFTLLAKANPVPAKD